MARRPSTQSAGAGATSQPRVQVPALSPANNTSTISVGTGLIPVQTTQPKFVLRHNISDEELEILKEGNRDGLSEAFWAFVAGALVALPAAAEALYNAYVSNPPIPLNPLHLFEVIVFAGCVVLAAAIRIIWRRRGKRVTTLVDEIRARTAHISTP